MKTEIKHSAGDKVFWLSSKGFMKGIVKQVILIDSILTNTTLKMVKQKEIKYLLWFRYNTQQIKEHG